MILTRPLKIPHTAERNNRMNSLSGWFFLYPACHKKDPSGLLTFMIEEKTVERAPFGVLSATEPIDIGRHVFKTVIGCDRYTRTPHLVIS
jgi:hypothetical protein